MIQLHRLQSQENDQQKENGWIAFPLDKLRKENIEKGVKG